MSRVTLPWPDKRLNPNGRVHWSKRAKAASADRKNAYYLTLERRPSTPAEGPVVISMQFRPPDRRKRDLDNVLASCKPMLDGIADALKVDDERFELRLIRGEPVKGGCVVVSIGGEQLES